MATINWLGTTSTDWFTDSNWDTNTVPTSIDDVVIGTTGGFQPTIGGTPLFTVNKITINGTDTLTVGDGTSGNSVFLTVTTGVTIGGGGSIIGQGFIEADITVNGAATIGVSAVNSQNTPQLVINGAISDPLGNLTLSLGNDANLNPDELILNFASQAQTVDFNGGTGHLVLQFAGGAGVSLDVGTQMDIGAGAVFLAGSTSTDAILTDTNGITLAGGTIFGVGTVDGNITGTGTIEASGGTLRLLTAIGNSAGPTYQIDDGASNILQVGDQIGDVVGTGNTFEFLGAAGELSLFDDTGLDTTIDGLNVGVAGAMTNFVDIEGHTVTISTVSGQGTLSGIIELSDGAVLHLTNLNSAAWFANAISDGAGGTNIFVSDTACYRRGTLILTDNGEVAVEDLAIGDHVMTFSGVAKPVKWIGHRAYDGRFVAGNRAILPIRIAAGALANGVPARDLRVSPGHALYIDGVLVQAEQLINGATIIQETVVDRIEYFHIELDAHDIIIADGAPAESYIDCDNRGKFHNAADFAQLYPDDDRPHWQYCAPLLDWHSPESTVIRAAIIRRAEALGHLLDLDPDLHLVVDGVVLRPEAVEGVLYRFAIPAGSKTASLSSRSTAPAEVWAEARDLRRLGVPVERLVLDDGNLRIDAAHGYAGLADGFHEDEATHRWTDGLARLPEAWLRAFPGGFTLDVHLIPSGLPYRLAPPRHARAASAA